jgi:hypothetical protein
MTHIVARQIRLCTTRIHVILQMFKILNITNVVEIYALLGYYSAYNGNSLLTFRDILSVPSSKVPWIWYREEVPKRRVRNYHCTLRNIPEERRSHLHRGRSLKSRRHVVIINHIAHTKNIALSCKRHLYKNPHTRNTDTLDRISHSTSQMNKKFPSSYGIPYSSPQEKRPATGFWSEAD